MTFGFALKTLQQQSGLEFKLIIKTQRAEESDFDPRNYSKHY